MNWRQRRLRHYARFAWFLAREFRAPLLLLAVLVFGGGLVVHVAERGHGVGYVEGAYDVFTMVFLNSAMREFPDSAGVRVLLFLVPLLGLFIIADGLVRFGMLMFARKQQLQEWWQIVTKSMSNHIVVVGLGRVGYRIARELMDLDVAFVVIERDTGTSFARELQDMNVPVIFGEARSKTLLERANVADARAIILATDDDMTNLDAALTAREIKPGIRVVVRLFDETLASKVASAFHLPALSASQQAAPAFVAAALERQVYQRMEIGGVVIYLGDFAVAEDSPLVGHTIGAVSREQDVSIVVLRRGDTTDHRPDPAIAIVPNDVLVVAGERPKMRAFELEAAGRHRRQA